MGEGRGGDGSGEGEFFGDKASLVDEVGRNEYEIRDRIRPPKRKQSAAQSKADGSRRGSVSSNVGSQCEVVFGVEYVKFRHF